MILSEIKMLKNSCHIQPGMPALGNTPNGKRNTDVFSCHHKNTLPLLLPWLLHNLCNLSTHSLEWYVYDLLQMWYQVTQKVQDRVNHLSLWCLVVSDPLSFKKIAHSRTYCFLTILALRIKLDLVPDSKRNPKDFRETSTSFRLGNKYKLQQAALLNH